MPFKPLAIVVLTVVLGFAGRIGADAKQAAADPPPSVELLEFLADWETADGQWNDPALFDPALLPAQEPNHETPVQP